MVKGTHQKRKIMVKGQGFFYSDIGKHARDILHADFSSEKRFTIATYPSTGEGAFFASATCEHLPGLKTICSFAYPNIGTSKVEVQCTDADVGGGVCASMELTTKPIIKLSSVLANNDFSVGSEISFNTASGRATKSDFGFSFTLSHNQIVSLNLCNTNEGDTINISNYDVVCPETNTAVATELSHCLSRNQSILSVGIQHALNPSTLLKIRGNNNGKLSAVLHHDLMNPRTRLSIFGEINTKVVSKNLKYGVAFSVMP